MFVHKLILQLITALIHSSPDIISKTPPKAFLPCEQT